MLHIQKVLPELKVPKIYELKQPKIQKVQRGAKNLAAEVYLDDPTDSWYCPHWNSH